MTSPEIECLVPLAATTATEGSAAKMATFSLTVDVRTLMSRHDDEGGRPQVCGFYSLDGKRRYHGDLSQLRYLRQPSKEELARGFDLDVGTAAAIARDDARENPRLDNLLRWLMDPHVDKDHLSKNPEIVTNRRTLVCLMHTPFENPNWKITAKLFDGVIYLFSTWRNELPETTENRSRSMWGLKFEEYMTKGQFGSDAAVAEDLTVEDPKFYAVFAYKMRQHRILYGAEIDCVESPRKVEKLQDLQNSDTCFIEFKTNKILEDYYKWATMKRNKFPKWWEQCYLTNINKVFCGFRTDQGIVNKLHRFTTSDMLNSKFVRELRWGPQVCLNFMDEALAFIKDITLRNSPNGTFWEFEAMRNSHIIEVMARRCEENNAGGDILLPTWFISP